MVEILYFDGWQGTLSCVRIHQETSSRTKKNPSKKSTDLWRLLWLWSAESVMEQSEGSSMMNGALFRFKDKVFYRVIP